MSEFLMCNKLSTASTASSNHWLKRNKNLNHHFYPTKLAVCFHLINKYITKILDVKNQTKIKKNTSRMFER